MSRPKVHIIAGPNGSGKTTFAKSFLPSMAHCNIFINVDLIAAGLSPLLPNVANIKAARILLTQIHDLSVKKETFGFETTLAGKTYVPILRGLKSRGYEIHIYFLWIESTKLALKRISDRVKLGGHDVPKIDVLRRYKAGLRNLFTLYQRLSDSVTIIDNSQETPKIVAIGNSDDFQILEPEIFSEMKHILGTKDDK